MSVRIDSKNAGISNDDHIREVSERFYVNVLAELVPAFVGYAKECQEGNIENNEESIYEYLKLKPYVSAEPTTVGSKIPAGKATSILRPGGATGTRGAAKGKELSNAHLAMYTEICNDEWDFEWDENKCQRFCTAGKKINKFCGAKPSSGEHFCSKCLSLTSQNKIIESFVDNKTTPREWYEQKKANCKETASEKLGLDRGQSVKKDGPKQVSRSPPVSKAPARVASPAKPLVRIYQGKGKPQEGKYYWCRSEGIEGGFVFDEEKNPIGRSVAAQTGGEIKPLTKIELEKFNKFIKSVEIETPAVKAPLPPAKSSESSEQPAKRTPARPPSKPVTKPASDEEEEDEEEEDMDEEAIDMDEEESN